MSKKRFKKAMKRNRVEAIPSRVIKNSKGVVERVFYDIYGNARMYRTKSI